MSQVGKQILKGSRSLRLASFNLLNTKDRYDEREGYLKEQMYKLNADVVGL